MRKILFAAALAASGASPALAETPAPQEAAPAMAETPAPAPSSTLSVKPPHLIALSGFEKGAKSDHMMAWLGRGPETARFVAADVEAEIYRQTPKAQVLSIECEAEPKTELGLLLEGEPGAEEDGRGLVTSMVASFPLIVTLRDEAGATWRLRTSLAYDAQNLRKPSERKVSASFTVLGHRKL
ncbi:hypothetical protein [Neomegalonema sp.]|uniref:hypothetical protein n=1 Tax=Neomegalonema sp. TaxID=2039713 RepID=UPI002608E3EF|nr:hypothetical protein [Neomegalonema sp.]MDD2869790.1 hypothetical protein [Neomegalonema sp.]